MVPLSLSEGIVVGRPIRSRKVASLAMLHAQSVRNLLFATLRYQ